MYRTVCVTSHVSISPVNIWSSYDIKIKKEKLLKLLISITPHDINIQTACTLVELESKKNAFFASSS